MISIYPLSALRATLLAELALKRQFGKDSQGESKGKAFCIFPLGKIAEFFFFYAKIIENFFKVCYTVCAKQN